MQFDLMTMQGQNHHHSQKPQNQQCTQQSQHCSHFQSHYQSTLSQIMQASTVQQLPSTELCLRIVWLSDGPAPGWLSPEQWSMVLWGRHMDGPSLLSRQESKLFVIFLHTLQWFNHCLSENGNGKRCNILVLDKYCIHIYSTLHT